MNSFPLQPNPSLLAVSAGHCLGGGEKTGIKARLAPDFLTQYTKCCPPLSTAVPASSPPPNPACSSPFPLPLLFQPREKEEDRQRRELGRQKSALYCLTQLLQLASQMGRPWAKAFYSYNRALLSAAFNP